MCLGEIFPHRFFVSRLVGKQPRKVDLPFMMDLCQLGQATVSVAVGTGRTGNAFSAEGRLRRLSCHGGLKPCLSRVHSSLQKPLEVFDLQARSNFVVNELHDVFLHQGQESVPVNLLKFDMKT